VRLAGVAGLVMAVAGCWPAPGQGPDRRSHNTSETAITVATVGNLEQAWSVVAGTLPLADPVTSTAGVHVNDAARAYAFTARTGARRWAVDAPFLEFDLQTQQEQVFVRGDQVLSPWTFDFVGVDSGTVWLDAATGAEESTTAGKVDAVRGRYLVTSITDVNPTFSSTYFGLTDLDDPAASWGGVLDVNVGYPPPTLGADRVFVSGNGHVRAFDVVGTTDCEIFPDHPGDLGPCPAWITDVDQSGDASPVLSQDQSTLYVAGGGGNVYALDTATGDVLWVTDVGSTVADSPALDGTTLFVPTGSGQLVALSASDGALLWSGTAGSPLTVQPAIAGGVVFTGSADGTVHAFAASGCGQATCGDLWSADAGAAVTGAPAVSNGQAYVGTADGHLVAYRLHH
jgi:outer membrane protein assembly factor BamB